MDIFKTFTIQLVIHLLTNVNCYDICNDVSSLMNSAEDIQCTGPLIALYTIGYIQCLKTCIRYTGCEVLRYNKPRLECYLYLRSSCVNSSGDDDSNLYMKRNDIDQSIGGTCRNSGCPNTCVSLKNNPHCFSDRVATHRLTVSATFVDIDGDLFGLYPFSTQIVDAKLYCNSLPGQLANLDTPKKKKSISDAAEWQYSAVQLWYVGASLHYGQWLWSNGESVDTLEMTGGSCVVLFKDRLITDICERRNGVVCEML